MPNTQPIPALLDLNDGEVIVCNSDVEAEFLALVWLAYQGKPTALATLRERGTPTISTDPNSRPDLIQRLYCPLRRRPRLLPYPLVVHGYPKRYDTVLRRDRDTYQDSAHHPTPAKPSANGMNS